MLTSDSGSDLRAVLAPVTALGGFFPVEVDPIGAGWQSLTALSAADSPERDDLVAGVQATLSARGGPVERRVAASLWQLGWSARLVAPWLGAAVLSAEIPAAGPDDVLWRRATGQPVPLGLRASVPLVVASVDAAYDVCVRSLVQPLLEAVAAAYHVSDQVLWGNVASTIAGTGALIPGAGPFVRELLGHGQLAGRGGFEGAVEGNVGRRFRRRSCCLLYRVAGSGICGDCVLRPTSL